MYKKKDINILWKYSNWLIWSNTKSTLQLVPFFVLPLSFSFRFSLNHTGQNDFMPLFDYHISIFVSQNYGKCMFPYGSSQQNQRDLYLFKVQKCCRTVVRLCSIYDLNFAVFAQTRKYISCCPNIISGCSFIIYTLKPIYSEEHSCTVTITFTNFLFPVLSLLIFFYFFCTPFFYVLNNAICVWFDSW